MTIIRNTGAVSERRWARMQKDMANAPQRADGEEARRISDEGRRGLSFEQRSCTGKLAFRSKAAVIKWTKKRPPSEFTARVYPYHCPNCDQWHTTKQKH